MSGIYFKLECQRNLSVLIHPLVSEGLKYIHGFNAILTTLWYLKDVNTFTVLMQF
jgi:hypothetical protein